MDKILTLFLLYWLTNVAENLSLGVPPLRANIDEDLEKDDPTTALCQLPLYPDRGGYLVLNQANTKPGDVLENVSIVKYKTDKNNKVFEITRFTCSLGEWYQDIFTFESTKLYFYTSWCPYFCKCFFSDNGTECSPPNTNQTQKTNFNSGYMVAENKFKVSETISKLCVLPPYPTHGSYTVRNNPNAKPGDKFKKVSFIQYTIDEANMVVVIENFKCSSGVWYQKIFKSDSEKLFFYTDWCPNLCSHYFGKEITEYAEPPIKNRIWVETEMNAEQITEFDYCVLPEKPKFGNYAIVRQSEVLNRSDVFESLRLSYTCDDGYNIEGIKNIYCSNGTWSAEIPKCTKFCHLIRQPGVEYLCDDEESGGGFRPCNDYVKDGSVIKPECKSPHYYSKSKLRPMTCVNGEWDMVVEECEAVCGLRLLEQDRSADPRQRAPWNVGIYTKEKQPFELKCAGSIVAKNLVISEAYCFYDIFREINPSVNFIVAAGKAYRSWLDPNDDKAQTSEIDRIKIPSRFDTNNNQQYDIALVFLNTQFKFDDYVWPVCVNFDIDLDASQLTPGRKGVIATWGDSKKELYSKLRVMEYPNVDGELCESRFVKEVTYYGMTLTSEEICFGYDNSTALCEESNGVGFAVAEPDPHDPRKKYYFLRGSIAMNNKHLCRGLPYTIMTKVSTQEQFLRENSNGLLF